MPAKPPAVTPPQSARAADSEAEAMLRLIESMTAASTRSEYEWFASRLSSNIAEWLDQQPGKLIDLANSAFSDDPLNANAFYMMIESVAATVHKRHRGKDYEIRLFMLPLLAWSSFRLPSPQVDAATLAALTERMKRLVFPNAAFLSLSDRFVSLDQLPSDYGEIFYCCRTLLPSVWRSPSFALPLYDEDALDNDDALSDSRALLGLVAIERGLAPFSWVDFAQNQGYEAAKNGVLERWRQEASKEIQPLFTGCSIELMLPHAFFEGQRITDAALRPFSLNAALLFLKQTLAIDANDLLASIGYFVDDEGAEYRIGFAVGNSGEQVLHGLVWPLLNDAQNDDDGHTEETIVSLLKQYGVGRINLYPDQFPMEYCPGCNAPLFANGAGELVHANLPEGAPDRFAALH